MSNYEAYLCFYHKLVNRLKIFVTFLFFRYKKHPDAIVGLGSVTIHFHTDRSGNYRGFKLAYKSKY